MPFSGLNPMHFWHLVTRLGEAQIALPAALLAALALLRWANARPFVLWWVALLGLAACVTMASKVAFLGWGVCWPELNYTGISGHAMFAAAVYPLLLGTLARRAPPIAQRLALAAGCALALLIGISRVMVGAHSASEVVAGWLTGGMVSAAAMALASPPAGLIGPLIPVVVALWLALMPVRAPPSRTHSMVTRLALALSGHKIPYTRNAMLRELHRRQSTPPASAPPAHAANEVREI